MRDHFSTFICLCRVTLLNESPLSGYVSTEFGTRLIVVFYEKYKTQIQQRVLVNLSKLDYI